MAKVERRHRLAIALTGEGEEREQRLPVHIAAWVNGGTPASSLHSLERLAQLLADTELQDWLVEHEAFVELA